MDDILKNTIDKILQLCAQNPEFDKELRRRMQIDYSLNSHSNDNSVCNDVHFIREALEIKADNSISYDFILSKGNQRLRDQLLIDNLRMENAALNLKDKEQERFYVFCVNAFYQIENVVNFYFYVKYPNITDLLKTIENATINDGKYAFTIIPTKEYKNVGDIEIASKLSAICNILFPGDKIKITYSQLRQVRNEGAHRCMIILEEHDESNALYKFFKYNTFNSIRTALKRLVSAIKEDLDSLNQTQCKKGVIINMLPSIVFIKIEDKTIQLPIKRLINVTNKKAGTIVNVYFKNSQIVDIKDTNM